MTTATKTYPPQYFRSFLWCASPSTALQNTLGVHCSSKCVYKFQLTHTTRTSTGSLCIRVKPRHVSLWSMVKVIPVVTRLSFATCLTTASSRPTWWKVQENSSVSWLSDNLKNHSPKKSYMMHQYQNISLFSARVMASDQHFRHFKESKLNLTLLT